MNSVYVPVVGDIVATDGHAGPFTVQTVDHKSQSAILGLVGVESRPYLTSPIPWAHIRLVKRAE